MFGLFRKIDKYTTYMAAVLRSEDGSLFDHLIWLPPDSIFEWTGTAVRLSSYTYVLFPTEIIARLVRKKICSLTEKDMRGPVEINRVFVMGEKIIQKEK